MNSIETNFEELTTILSKECQAHEHLLDAATGVNEAIKESDVPTLQMRSAHLDGQVSAIEQIEKLRGECCVTLSRELGIERTTVKLASLIEKAPARFREKLATLHRALKEIINKISTVNVSNRVLLEEGLELVRGRLSLIANPVDRFAQYRQGGRLKSSSMPLHPFINQTV
jgi:flagellar biosynthesis/type III secretory pathway chaperone